ncbi:PadR family transcriptional regulator [bacterium]|nr:PadR family transcriptional regulator [bacterium]
MPITLNEQILLIAIWKLADEAYGVKIQNLLSEHTGKEVAYGTLYNNLDKLIKKGYLNSRMGEPTAIRGGKRKAYYSLTLEGKKALQAARELQAQLWSGIPNMEFKS